MSDLEVFDDCQYKTIAHNILKLPNGEQITIMEATECAKDPQKYYEMIPKSPFGKTKWAIRFYKKTHYLQHDKKNKHIMGLDAITELIIPPETRFHVELGEYVTNIVSDTIFRFLQNLSLNNILAKFRFERALVGCQKWNDTQFDKTYSYFDREFAYTTGEMVTSKKPFYDYDQWINTKIHNYNATCESGIHAFPSKEKAEIFLF